MITSSKLPWTSCLPQKVLLVLLSKLQQWYLTVILWMNVIVHERKISWREWGCLTRTNQSHSLKISMHASILLYGRKQNHYMWKWEFSFEIPISTCVYFSIFWEIIRKVAEQYFTPVWRCYMPVTEWTVTSVQTQNTGVWVRWLSTEHVICSEFCLLAPSLRVPFETVLCIPSWTQTQGWPWASVSSCFQPQYWDYRYS